MHTWEQTVPRRKQEDTTPIDIPSQRFFVCVTVPLGFRANRHSPSFGVTETLRLRLLHCAPASKANLADSSTDGRVVVRAYSPWLVLRAMQTRPNARVHTLAMCDRGALPFSS